ERAKVNLPNATTSDDNTIDQMIAACSDAIRKYCRLDFAVSSYDELYNGNGDRRLLLRQYPIQSVEAVRYRPVTVVKITNNTAANVQARVSVTSTGLSLIRVNAGVRYTDTSVTWASNATLTALVTAVNALGNGWSAQVVGDATNYGGWPSSDLYVKPSYGDGTTSQGALACVNGSFAELKLHTYQLAAYPSAAPGWLPPATPPTPPALLHPP